MNLSFFLALGVMLGLGLGLGGTGGFLGPVDEVPGFIPWLAFTNWVNQGVVHRGADHLRFHGATEASSLAHATFITSVEFGPEITTFLSHHDGMSSFHRMSGFGHGA